MERWKAPKELGFRSQVGSPEPGAQPSDPQASSSPEPSALPAALEPSVKIANLRQRLHMISRTGKTGIHFDAISDLIEEARFNKSAIVDDACAATELRNLLAMPWPSRRAWSLRELTEFGRNIDFPPAWHGSDRMRSVVWYHALQRLKLVEFNENDIVVRQGQLGSCAYWLLSEGAVYRSTPGVKRLELLRALEQAAAAAEAPAPSAASFTRPSLGLRRPSQLSQLNSPGMDGLRTSMTTSLQPSAMNSPAPHDNHLSQPHALPSPSPSPAAHPPVPPLAPASSCTSTTISRSASLAPPSARLPRISLTAGGLEHTPRVHAGRQPSMHLLLERGEQLGLTPEQRAAAVAAAAGGGSSIGAEEEEEEEEEEEDVPDVALDVWDLVGQEALQGRKSRANVVATAKLVCTCLSADDYHAVLNEVLASETFDSLKLVHSMITQKAQRTPAQLQDMAAQLALFDLFHTMDEDFRLEVCRLVEYLHCPEGFVLFEEGDKIDFCYVVLQGKVVFNKYNDKARRQDEIGTKSTGEHFGTLLTLSSGEKKRPFTAITASRCEMAIISRVGYNRILKKQLQGAISARISLLQSLNVMNANSYQALQRVAINCQDETFHAGATIVEPANYPNKLFVIMEGEAKLTYVTEYPNQMPLDTMASTHPQVKQPTAAELMAPDPPTATKRHDHAATGGRVSMGGGRAGGARNSSNVRDGQRDGADGGASSGGGVASTAAEARARDALATAQQLEGGTHRGAASQGLRLAGTRRKVVIEVARLSKGDVFNGVTLFGKAPVFSVVACTPMRLVSLEADSVEGFVGREATRALKSLVSQSHSWAMQRLAQMLSVRQTVDACIMDPATHRVMHANAQRNFMEHYVPSGVTEMLASAAEQRQQQWEAAGGSGPAPGAAQPHPSMASMASPAPPLASPQPPPGSLYPGAGAGARSAHTQALGTGSALDTSLLAPGPPCSMAEIRTMEDVMRLPTTTVFAPRAGKRPTHLGHAPPAPASHTGKGTGGRRAHPSGPPAAASTSGAAATGAGGAPLPPQAAVGEVRGSPPAPLPSAGASGQVQAAAAWPGGSGGKVGGLGGSRQRRRRGRARHMVWAGQMATALLDVSEEGLVPCRQPPWAPHALAAAASMEAPTLGAPRPLAGSDQAAVNAKGGMGSYGTGSGEGEDPGQAGQGGGHKQAVLAGLALGQQGGTAAPMTPPLPPSLPKSPAAGGGSTAAATAAATAGGRPSLPAPLLPGCPSSPRFELPMSLTLTLSTSRSSRGCAPHHQDPSPPADSSPCPPLSPGPPPPHQQQQQPLGTPPAQGQQPPSASALLEDRGITPQLTAAAQPLRHLPHPGPSAASPTQRTGLAQYGGSTPPPDSRDPSRSSTPLTGSTGAGHSQDGVAAPGAAASCGQAEGQRGPGLTHEATAGGGGSGRRLASPLASTKRDLEPAACLAAAAGVGAGAGVGVGGSLAAGGGSVGRIQGGGSVASEAVRGAGGAGREVREPMGLAGRPRLPPAISPVLASPSLTASVIMQPATSPGTAMYSRRRNATIASGTVTAQGELDLDPPTPRQPSTPAPPWPPAALPTHALSAHSIATYGLLGPGGMGGPLSSQVSFPPTLSAESSGWPVGGREPAGNALPWLPDLGAGLGPEPSWLSSSSGQQQQEGQPGRGAAATVDTVVILPDRLSVYQHSFGDGAEANSGTFPRSHGRLGRRGHAHEGAAKQRQQDVSITGSMPDMSSRGPWRIQLASQASDVALSLPQESPTARLDNVMARAAPDDVNVLKQSYASRRKLRASTDGSKGVSAQRGVVRMIAVSKDHEPTLPLDCDQTAPLLNDHKLSRPTLEDINYILHRWGTRWASEREEELAQRRRAPEVFDTLTPRTKDAVTAKTEYRAHL